MNQWMLLRLAWAFGIFISLAFGYVHLSSWQAYVTGIAAGVLIGELLSMTKILHMAKHHTRFIWQPK